MGIIIIETTIKNQKRKPNKVVPYEKEDRSVLLSSLCTSSIVDPLLYGEIDFPLFPPPPANRLMSYHQPLYYFVRNSGKRRQQQN